MKSVRNARTGATRSLVSGWLCKQTVILFAQDGTINDLCLGSVYSPAAKALIMIFNRLANDANSNLLAHLLMSHRLNRPSWELAVFPSTEWSKWRFCEQLGSATAIMRQENMRPRFSARTCCLRLGEIPNYSAAARGFDPAVIIKKWQCVWGGDGEVPLHLYEKSHEGHQGGAK